MQKGKPLRNWQSGHSLKAKCNKRETYFTAGKNFGKGRRRGAKVIKKHRNATIDPVLFVHHLKKKSK